MTDKRRSLEQVLSASHLPALDGLRAVSVFIVITYHFWLGRIPGDLGVSTFFVLSGFLITWLLLQEWRQEESISVKNFYFRRTLRIFPAYYCFPVFSFAQEYVRGYYWTPGLVESGLFYGVNYYNAFNGHPSTAIAHAWSLAIEEQFYLLWPMLFLFLSRRGTKAMAWTLAGIIGIVVLWRSFLYLGLHVPSAYVYNAFDTRFDNIALGCLIAVCVEWNWFRAFANALAYRTLLPIITVALLLVSRQGGERGVSLFPRLHRRRVREGCGLDKYDVVVLSDVLYYEPKLTLLWSILPRLLRPGGSVVIRVPNKFLLIQLGQFWFRLLQPTVRRLLQVCVRYFNPEHIYIFRRSYLETRLRSLGFTKVRALPSPLLSVSMTADGGSAYFRLALIANRLSRGKLLLTPSMLVIGTHRRLNDPLPGGA